MARGSSPIRRRHVDARHRREPERLLPRHQGRAAAHEGPPERPHRHDRLHLRQARWLWLYHGVHGVQARRDRAHPRARRRARGSGLSRHHGQRDLPGLRASGDGYPPAAHQGGAALGRRDLRSVLQASGPAATNGGGGGDRPRRRLPGVAGFRRDHGPGAQRRRRLRDVVSNQDEEARMATVLYEQKDRVVTITMNRPEVMNAIDPETHEALVAAWTRFRDDDSAWVAILTGAGDKAFSAGADLKKMIPGAFGGSRGYNPVSHTTPGLGRIPPRPPPSPPLPPALHRLP